MKASVILACAGKVERANLGKNKIFYEIDGKPCLMHALDAFYKNPNISQILVTANE